MPTNELDLGVVNLVLFQVREQGVAEQVGVYGLLNPRRSPVLCNDLMDSASRVRLFAPGGFKQVFIIRDRSEVGTQGQPELLIEQDIPVPVPLAGLNEDFARVKVNVGAVYRAQLRDPAPGDRSQRRERSRGEFRLL